jgi:nucleotide-binding universal stress UspA family protein
MSVGLSSVVVATDFSKSAQAALDRALSLPLAPAAQVHVVHVLHADIPGTLKKQAEAEAERKLEKLVSRAKTGLLSGGRGLVKLVGEVLEGAAAERIAKHARSVDADLVVVGRHGPVPVLDFFIGTTAQKVARLGEQPVLLVQGAPRGRYQQALVALKLGKDASTVLKGAVRMLESDARVALLHASSLPFEQYVDVPTEALAELRGESLADARDELQGVAKKSGLDSVRIIIEQGDARAVIRDESEALAPDLVVVGAHPKKRLQQMLLGSVAEWVLTHAKSDVLVARA